MGTQAGFGHPSVGGEESTHVSFPLAAHFSSRLGTIRGCQGSCLKEIPVSRGHVHQIGIPARPGNL